MHTCYYALQTSNYTASMPPFLCLLNSTLLIPPLVQLTPPFYRLLQTDTGSCLIGPVKIGHCQITLAAARLGLAEAVGIHV